MKYPKQKPKMIMQQDQTDCGIACLLSVIYYHGGSNTLERLRQLSGTSSHGATLLGLCRAAEACGFQATGYLSEMEALINYPSPVILHLEPDKQFQHYVVCFGTFHYQQELRFAIGDPASGIISLSIQQLEALWKSKVCLTLEPAADFKERNDYGGAKLAWFKKLIIPDLSALATACSLGVIVSALGLVMAFFSRHLVDHILPARNLQSLYSATVCVAILLVSKELMILFRQYLLLKQSRDFNIRITGFFFRRLLQLPVSFFNFRKTGEVTARLMDLNRIQRSISHVATSTITDLMASLGCLTCIFLFSLKAGLICLVMVPSLFMVVHYCRNAVVEHQRLIMSNYATTETNIISTLQNMEAIKAYNQQTTFLHRNKEAFQNYQESIVRFGKVQIRLTFIINLLCILLLAIVIAISGYDVIQARETAGSLMAIISLLSSLLTGVVNLALTALPVREGEIAFERMFDLVSIPAEQTDARPKASLIHEKGQGTTGAQSELFPSHVHAQSFKSLQIRKLTFHFPGNSQLFKNIWLDLNRGEMVAIMGENGSGKSTLLNILQQNYRPEAGDIYINGSVPLHTIPLSSWRRIIGIVPQHIRLFNGTILENIAFQDAVSKPLEVAEVLNEYGFSSFFDTLPQSYATVVGEGGTALPGGLQQLVALARALYHQPQLLILDEVTAGMDRTTERFVLGLLNRLKKDMAILFVTHRLYVLKSFCERMYILERGYITAYGDHAGLLRSENFYSQYWKDIFS